MTSDSSALPFFIKNRLYAPLAPWLGRADAWPPALETMNRWALERKIMSGARSSLRFEPALTRLPAIDYERKIAQSGRVPIRARNLHDIFNALAWLVFPQTKAALNRLHRDATPGRRTPRRDFATLLDESGMLIAYRDPALIELLCNRAWQELFWLRRADVEHDMRFFVVGHAIYEKAQNPYPGITAHALAVPVEDAFFELPLEQAGSQIDAVAAKLIDGSATPAPKSLTPLPVFGVPGWHENQTPEFYADRRYFRPPRDL